MIEPIQPTQQMRRPMPGLGSDPASVRQRIEAMERILERMFVVPGINRPVGLDVILNIVPGLGTISAAVLGLVFGLLLGIVLGFMAALLPLFAQLLEPVMILLNAIPRVILAPLFVIWLGIDLSSKVALALILVAVLVFFAVYNGIKDVDKIAAFCKAVSQC